jgi:hypothetical protein
MSGHFSLIASIQLRLVGGSKRIFLAFEPALKLH